MSQKYNYLDIAISTSDGTTPSANYSFNSAQSIALASLHDIATHFANLTDGYILWQIGSRRAFTYFHFGATGQQLPQLAITLRLDPDVLMPGHPIVSLFSSLRHMLADGNALTHESLVSAIADAGFTEKPLRSPHVTDLLDGNEGLCCRTYISSTDLANMLAFPRQKEYKPFQGVIMVPATVTLSPGSAINMINTPVIKNLAVLCPPHVKASRMTAEFSDRLTLTYTMEGFDSCEVSFEVGNTNRYVRINGPALIVNTAAHSGIVFSRRIPYTVLSSAGNVIDQYTILINGRTANRSSEGFEVTSTDFTDGVIELTVSSTNFGVYRHTFTPLQLSENIPLSIVLEPEARQIVVRLDFGGGRILTDNITLEKSTPEYNMLRGGSFHGFRAHRVVGTTPETFNVDMKVAAAPEAAAANADSRQMQLPLQPPRVADNTPNHQAPVAPAISKAPSAIWDNTRPQRKAPVFEKDTPDTRLRKSNLPDMRTPGLIDESHDDLRDDTVAGEKTQERTFNPTRWMVAGAIALAVGLVIWWVCLLTGNSEQTSVEPPLQATAETALVDDGTVPTTEPAAAANQTASTPATDASQTSAQPSADETADITYLNDNKVWRLESIKSEKYRSLITAAQRGDIDAFATHPYFTSAKGTNDDARKIQQMLWRAKGTDNQKANVTKLQKHADSGNLNLHDTMEDLARSKPKDANTAPIPGA